MDSRPFRIAPAWPVLAGWLACAISGAGGPAQAPAQTTPPGQGRPAGSAEASRAEAQPADRSVSRAKPVAGQDQARAKDRGQAQPPRREPSAEYQESIRKTVEKRRQRRARRAQAQGSDDLRPIGAVVPWPMPPALIIRQTPQVHDEVGSFLGGLRRGR